MRVLGRWHSQCRLLLLAVIVGVPPSLLSSCTYVEKDGDSDKVTTTTICILAMCESSDRVERVGNPEMLGGVFTETVDERSETKQGEDGQLAVDPTGL